MIKSLYVRVVLVFIGAVVFSLSVALSVSTSLYINEHKGAVEDELIAIGQRIIVALEQSSPDRVDEYLRQAAILPSVNIEIFDPSGRSIYRNNSVADIDAEQLTHVLNGGVYRGNVHSERVHRLDRSLIGLPFQLDNHPYALFLTPKLGVFLSGFQKVVRTILTIALVVGSLCILIAARYIVRPLRVLTEATRKVAAGNFDVSIRAKSKDEVGQLTSSFNEMASQLAALDQMRADFVTSVSHEIQSPLTSIAGFTKALRNKPMDDRQRLHYLTIIEEESERLSRMSQNLLRLSSLQSGRTPVVPRSFRLDEQLRGIVIASEPQWASKALDIELELDDTEIEADEDLLNQVWTNVLHNAIKFTPDGGRIRLTLECADDLAIVRIADTGIGIAEEERSRIFIPFHKTDKSRDAAVQGNGLGLSIVKRIVDLHQGEIAIGDAPGIGTIVTVKLPLRQAHL